MQADDKNGQAKEILIQLFLFACGGMFVYALGIWIWTKVLGFLMGGMH